MASTAGRLEGREDLDELGGHRGVAACGALAPLPQVDENGLGQRIGRGGVQVLVGERHEPVVGRDGEECAPSRTGPWASRAYPFASACGQRHARAFAAAARLLG
jgi:hypothetical protein